MGNNHQECGQPWANTIIQFGDGLYHSFMVILVMVDYWVYHFTWLLLVIHGIHECHRDFM